MKFLHRIQQGILAICLGILFGWSESQAATLRIGESYTFQKQGEKWGGRTQRDTPLLADVLVGHLNTLGINSFKELGRLLLAQGFRTPLDDQRWKLCRAHNNRRNQDFGYIDTLDNAGDLCKTSTLSALKDHLFDHGHLGWYPYAKLIRPKMPNSVVRLNLETAPRGIFNIGPAIRERVKLTRDGGLLPALGRCGGHQGYAADPQNDKGTRNFLTDPFFYTSNFEEAAINLITKLFSSDAFEGVNIWNATREENNASEDWHFIIEATYNGVPIQGISYTGLAPLTQENCLGFHEDETPTNRIRLAVGVDDGGRIYIISLYPISTITQPSFSGKRSRESSTEGEGFRKQPKTNQQNSSCRRGAGHIA